MNFKYQYKYTQMAHFHLCFYRYRCDRCPRNRKVFWETRKSGSTRIQQITRRHASKQKEQVWARCRVVDRAGRAERPGREQSRVLWNSAALAGGKKNGWRVGRGGCAHCGEQRHLPDPTKLPCCRGPCRRTQPLRRQVAGRGTGCGGRG